MINVEFQGYRSWAQQIKKNLVAGEPNNGWQIADRNPDISLYYGWSWKIPKEVYEDHLCLILHPSPLPKYRGGSPLQHQIMAGEKMSAVTILEVGERIDAGRIYSQTPFSLDGTLDDIFERIVAVGTLDTIRVLDRIVDGSIQPVVQDESQATIYKRRRPEQSELTPKDFEAMTAKELYDFIRALADPYPNAFIRCPGGKLYLKAAKLESREELEVNP